MAEQVADLTVSNVEDPDAEENTPLEIMHMIIEGVEEKLGLAEDEEDEEKKNELVMQAYDGLENVSKGAKELQKELRSQFGFKVAKFNEWKKAQD